MDRFFGKDRQDLPLGVVYATEKQTPLKSCPDPAEPASCAVLAGF